MLDLSTAESEDTRVKSADNPIWNERAEMVKPFLETPRSWLELCIWAREHSLTVGEIQNTIAWLSFHRIIECSSEEPFKWGLIAKIEEKAPAEAGSNCTTCGGFMRLQAGVSWCMMCGRPA